MYQMSFPANHFCRIFISDTLQPLSLYMYWDRLSGELLKGELSWGELYGELYGELWSELCGELGVSCLVVSIVLKGVKGS